MPKTRPSASSTSSAALVADGPPTGTNLVVLRGTLSRDPEERSLPSGDHLVAYELTVRSEAGSVPAPRAESVPVALFDPPASAAALRAGDDVVVVGRVRRRFFRAGGATASRTEVVASRVVPARARARVRSALTSVLGPLDGGG
jgi:single-strand DNA-binding protein